MIVKSGGILYLWDFDGTLFGHDEWKHLFHNNRACLKKGPYINPNNFDTRWSIMTSRPKMDKWFIKFVCTINGLYPEEIITQPTFFYRSKCKEDDFRYKEQTIKNILDHKRAVKFTPFTINKLIYVDNDRKCLQYLNSKNIGYEYLAITVADFVQGTYTQIA